jgi:hypothetical protein
MRFARMEWTEVAELAHGCLNLRVEFALKPNAACAIRVRREKIFPALRRGSVSYRGRRPGKNLKLASWIDILRIKNAFRAVWSRRGDYAAREQR